ncbi:DUF3108 domain-containing protein [Amorphus orientalis]|uniref:DUF3108 domain-containing protein n=1 Tax=Amorphus orientalis TaxID=649198 RepID=A0AAE4AR76_9HYPH|nr:DUF3108 domain-containing protein [Amorphus orientalis]MDQ0313813.1 hypothetical protein [Amorphus orientalis]
MRRRFIPIAILLAATAWPGAATAGERTTAGVRYDVSFKGVTIAKGSLSVILADDAYSVKVDMKPTGFASLLTASKVDAEVKGHLGETGLSPSSYRLVSVDPGETTKVSMRLADHSVASLSARPPLDPAPDRVDVVAGHKRGILDPISAAVLPIRRTGAEPDLKEACNRQLPVFDGWSRYQVDLAPKGEIRLRTPSYDGKAFQCSARWTPIAGHRANSESVAYLARNQGLEAAFVAVGDDVFVPVSISIETPHGVLSVQATDIKLRGVRLAAAE